MRERQPCLYCHGDRSAPDHAEKCDGQQGKRDAEPDPPKPDPKPDPPRRPPREFRSAYNLWPRPWTPDNPAFIGLSKETIDVICDDTINDAMIRALWRVLEDGEPRHAYDVIRQLEIEPWWKPGLSRSSKERFLRKIFDTGVARGYPLCSGNYGYAIGDAEMLRTAAKRERALERGARDKAYAFERLAEAVEGL